jgi:GST-like protein
MIDFYYWPTPNGWKVSIMLEETGLAYDVHPVHIGKGDQFKPEFLAISPNNRIPAIVDHDSPSGDELAIFESGATASTLRRASMAVLADGRVGADGGPAWSFCELC